MNKIMVATPMYGGMCTGSYMRSMMLLQHAVHARGWAIGVSHVYNESLIQRARNNLCVAFLKSECTHLLWIDADIGFDPQQILAMVDADKPVIAGIYPKKEINWQSVQEAVKHGVPQEQLKEHTGSFVVNLLDGPSATVPQNQPLEVLNAGTGCMLIQRHVLETLKSQVPTYTNDVTDLAGSLGQEPIHDFFSVSICPESNRLLSEDYDFCQKWRRAGGKIFAAPWVKLTHIGTYHFEGALIPERPTGNASGEGTP